MTVRTRFAPSPTGSLHVGGVRTALFCKLFAKQHGGKFLLRIEDTDQARSTEAATRGIIADMRWLGLDWDEGPVVEGDTGPYFQSQRREIYERYLGQLLDSGLAYEAWETKEELGALRQAAMAGGGGFTYKRPELPDEAIEAYREQGRVPVIRFASPDEAVVIHDKILGEVTIPSERVDDFVIRKADGFPTYHFAVVIDDHLMSVTQVLRGQEHLMNTAKHLLLYQAFKWEPPEHAHLPLIFNPTGSKMSKRDKAKAARAVAREAKKHLGHSSYEWLASETGIDLDQLNRFMKKKNDEIGIAEGIAKNLSVELPMIEVLDFKKAGYLPEAINNYMGLLGWNQGNDREFYTIDEFAEVFSLDRVSHTPARFDPEKLRWMNRQYIADADTDRLISACRDYIALNDTPLDSATDQQLGAIIELYKGRAHTLSELDMSSRFFFAAPSGYDHKAVKKHINKGGGHERLGEIKEVLRSVIEWAPDGIEVALSAFCEKAAINMGKVAQPLRIAVSGAAVTPPIYETLALIDQAEVLRRVDTAIQTLIPSA